MDDLLIQSCINDYLDGVKVILPNVEDINSIHIAMGECSRYGNLECLKFLYDSGNGYGALDGCMMMSSAAGMLNIVEYLMDLGVHETVLDNAYVEAAKNGKLNVVEYLQQKITYDITLGNACIHACDNRHIDVLKFIIPFADIKMIIVTLFQFANKNNDYDTMLFLKLGMSSKFRDDVLLFAIENNLNEIVIILES